jgi:hypothetical protein
MATLAQIEANRRNSQKSTGPRTEAGKAVCAQNAFKSGIYAEAPLVTGENPNDLDGLALAYRAAYRPANPAESALLETIVYAEWLLRRMRRVETQLWNQRTDSLHNSSFYQGEPEYELVDTFGGIADWLERVQKRVTALERTYHRALADLRRLQASRPPAPEPAASAPVEIGSVPPSDAIGFVAPAAVQPESLPVPAEVELPPCAIGFVPPVASNFPARYPDAEEKLPKAMERYPSDTHSKP